MQPVNPYYGMLFVLVRIGLWEQQPVLLLLTYLL